ncbi:MAG: aryl-sulfate sulfotransferase [Longimicrobiales bacterium]
MLRLLIISIVLVVCGCDSPTEPLRTALADLPPDLAAVALQTEGRPSAPYTMLELRQAGGFSGYVTINASGQPVWYQRSNSPFSFTRRANGNFVLLDTDRGLIEVNAAGDTVHTLEQQARPGRRIHHDAVATARNTILFIAEDWQMWRDTLLNGEAVWEWSPESGTVQKRWSALTHLDPASNWSAQSVRTNWLHTNAISLGPRGNIVLSLCALDQVISVSADYQRLEWSLGGPGATRAVDDPFSGQHTATEIAPGRVLLFDNGYGRTSAPYSRAAEYEIGAQTGRKVWEWRPAPDNWARLMGSARRLPNGNTLVGFGRARGQQEGSTGPIEVFEVTQTGTVVWRVRVGDAVNSMYRATPLFDF